MRTKLAATVIMGLSACSSSSPAVRAAGVDAGDATTRPVDAAPPGARVVADAADALAVVDAADAAADSLVDALGPLSSCVPVTSPPAPGCPETHGVAFMCAVTEADTLSSLGCSVADVVSSGEVLGCCPACPGTDAGACYQ